MTNPFVKSASVLITVTFLYCDVTTVVFIWYKHKYWCFL